MILLTILAFAGKILLWILLILAVILLLILLVPVTYHACILKEDEGFTANGSAGWMFHLIHAGFSFDQARTGHKLQLDVRIFGISLLKMIDRLKQRSIKKRKKQNKNNSVREIRWEAPKKPTVAPGQHRTQAIDITKTKHPGMIQRIAARIQALIGKLKNMIRRLRRFWNDASGWINYLQSDSFDRAKTCLLREGAGIFKHIIPRKLKGYLRIGTGDPAGTGLLIGSMYMLYPVFPEDLHLEPEFLESCLIADLTCRGHIQLGVLLYHIVRMILQKDIRRLISRIRGQMNKEKRNKKEKVRKKPWRKTMNFRTT